MLTGTLVNTGTVIIGSLLGMLLSNLLIDLFAALGLPAIEPLMGVLYGVRYRAKLSAKFFLGGVRIFVVMVFIAMLLNVGSHYLFGLTGIDETFNMFYISPFHECTLPVLNTVWHKLPYVPFVCVYFFGFILCALIMLTLFCVFTKGSRVGIRSRKARKLAYERDCIFYYGM